MKEQDNLVLAIAELNEELALSLVSKLLAEHDDPVDILAKCQQGMLQVGERYTKHQYYLSGLIMGGEIFFEVMKLVEPGVQKQTSSDVPGKVLLGTVAGDIHDLGKNIVKMLLICHKFTIYDIGVDVLPEEFLRRVNKLQPDAVGLSGLMTSSYDSMRDTVSVLRKGGCHVPIVIGGSQIDEDVFHYTGADYWGKDANDGVELFKRIIANSKK
jgi:methanogenic corrinoid protein MtbC1